MRDARRTESGFGHYSHRASEGRYHAVPNRREYPNDSYSRSRNYYPTQVHSAQVSSHQQSGSKTRDMGDTCLNNKGDESVFRETNSKSHSDDRIMEKLPSPPRNGEHKNTSQDLNHTIPEEAIMVAREELRKVMTQYVNVADPTESAARRARMRYAEEKARKFPLNFLGSSSASLLQNRRSFHRRTMENEIAPFTYSGSSGGMMNSHGESSGGVVAPSRFRDQLHHSSRSVMQQRRQDMVNREALCYTRLHEASLEAEVLRPENAELRSLNLYLKNDQLIRSSLRNRLRAPPLRMLSIGGNNENQNPAGNRDDDVSDESPTSVIGNEDVNRSSLPKSISVRSSGYSKASQGGGGVSQSRGAIPNPGTCGQQLTTTVTISLFVFLITQKVYVRGGKKEEEEEEEEIEVEVYNQGMTKTELCNKWQETGACPYGDHCQFAHGIKELRPVIRHPRYKTEVCRMVLAGDICPYGHRCHFRHSLSDQEKLTAAGCTPNNKSSVKVVK
ncbi:hypothetical protein DY000_02062932 [Brassica cretica]|uniref:C3H1-type domain-containing protein n=1 Tax=Brassica cretica TaxID=69181 RepID=A0ABQ7AN75_BRACR|nr:hypothetical protein DY000_02062932 [Brassica cretica]